MLSGYTGTPVTVSAIGSRSYSVRNRARKLTLTGSGLNFTQCRSDGFDLALTQSDGNTILPTYRAAFNKAGATGEIWALEPLVSKTNQKYILQCGNSGATDSSNAGLVFQDLVPTQGRTLALYRMTGLTLPTITDLQGMFNGAAVGSPTYGTSIINWNKTGSDPRGTVNQAIALNGTTQYLSFTGLLDSPPPTYTFAYLFQPTAGFPNSCCLFQKYWRNDNSFASRLEVLFHGGGGLILRDGASDTVGPGSALGLTTGRSYIFRLTVSASQMSCDIIDTTTHTAVAAAALRTTVTGSPPPVLNNQLYTPSGTPMPLLIGAATFPANGSASSFAAMKVGPILCESRVITNQELIDRFCLLTNYVPQTVNDYFQKYGTDRKATINASAIGESSILPNTSPGGRVYGTMDGYGGVYSLRSFYSDDYGENWYFDPSTTALLGNGINGGTTDVAQQSTHYDTVDGYYRVFFGAGAGGSDKHIYCAKSTAPNSLTFNGQTVAIDASTITNAIHVWNSTVAGPDANGAYWLMCSIPRTGDTNINDMSFLWKAANHAAFDANTWVIQNGGNPITSCNGPQGGSDAHAFLLDEALTTVYSLLHHGFEVVMRKAAIADMTTWTTVSGQDPIFAVDRPLFPFKQSSAWADYYDQTGDPVPMKVTKANGTPRIIVNIVCVNNTVNPAVQGASWNDGYYYDGPVASLSTTDSQDFQAPAKATSFTATTPNLVVGLNSVTITLDSPAVRDTVIYAKSTVTGAITPITITAGNSTGTLSITLTNNNDSLSFANDGGLSNPTAVVGTSSGSGAGTGSTNTGYIGRNYP